ncbi:MAG: hypothetical protein KF858_01820 [Candidatus Sumerlaeia bacterium]|nr:hypothetical protein [Candidatus Sumerlaeia bacterium]
MEFRRRVLAGVVALGMAAAAPQAGRGELEEAPEAATAGFAAQATATVDWTRSVGTINRALFSSQGFMQIYTQPNPLVLHNYLLTNPAGTHTRLETWIHQMEPENDNDDPWTFDWERLHPEKMVRFIEDREAFARDLERFEMEPLSLLCYNVDWLRSGNEDDPVANKEEWAEFAAAVVEAWNGSGADYRPRMRLAQVWNEPNMPHFYGGTSESYFELYRTTAERLHRNYPGVMVSGPAVSYAWHTEPDRWMEEFLRECGPQTDFISFHHYGPMGEGVEPLTEKVVKWATKFREIPGKEQGKVAITETDAWFIGWPKIQFMLERQFRFLDLSDLLLAVHHFSCLAYNESGNYTFGIIDEQGGVIEGTFWPYWLFRNLIGQQAHALRGGKDAAGFDLVASFEDRGGERLATAVFHNKRDTPLRVETALFLPPSGQDRVLVSNRLTEGRYRVDKVWRVPAGREAVRLELAFGPGEALALNLQTPGMRHFAFRDLNNQEYPWIGLTANTTDVTLGESFEVEAEVVNTLLSPVSGTLALGMIPAGWAVEALGEGASVVDLAPGARQTARFRLTAATLAEEGYAGPFAWLDDGRGEPLERLDRIAASIATTVKIHSPLHLQALPLPIEAVAGETNQATLQVTNDSGNAQQIVVTFRAPAGMTATTTRQEATVKPDGRVRLEFPFEIPAGTPPGTYTGELSATFAGVSAQRPIRVVVHPGAPAAAATPLDLTPHLNFDAISFRTDRAAFDSEAMGMFAYPGDYTPSGRIVRVRGVPFRMADLEAPRNVVLPSGQRIEVPRGRYRGAAMMGFGHDGKHPGAWTFHYADGTSQAVDSQIPEWCSPLPEGPENFREAFTAPHRYTPGGPALPSCQLYDWTLATDATRELVAIELPRMKHAYLFAVTLLGKE